MDDSAQTADFPARQQSRSPVTNADRTMWEESLAASRESALCGDFERGIGQCRQVQKTPPQSVEARRHWGSFSLQQGDLQNAVDCFTRAIEQAPDHAESHRHLGIALQAQGQFAAAVACLERSLRLAPLEVSSWVALSEILLQSGELTTSLDCLHQALQLDPQHRPARLLLGNLLKQLGELDAAVGHFRYVLDHEPHHVVASVNLAAALRAQGKTPEALIWLRRVVQSGETSPLILFNLANALVDIGEFSEARSHYEAALRTHPHPAKVFFNLTSITRLTPSQRPWLEEMESSIRPRLTTGDDWIHYHFAMGKSLDDLQEFDAAFSHFEQGNRRVPVEFNPAAQQAEFARWRACWSEPFLRNREHWSSEACAPVFIVGMPRSGTTLVEQLLAGIPGVQPLGERTRMGTLVQEFAASLGCEEHDTLAVERLTQADVDQMARDYLADVPEEAKRIHFTDKLPGNFLLLGWIALCFPNAVIIHCCRDPRDVCLSCYFQHFTARLPYTYDLHHLAACFQNYSRLMSHWHQVLPGRILDVCYEDLVESPEQELGKILARLDLPEETAQPALPVEPRIVQTASAWQVRQPIYRHARHRWRHYRSHLEPLLSIFGEGDEPVARFSPESL